MHILFSPVNNNFQKGTNVSDPKWWNIKINHLILKLFILYPTRILKKKEKEKLIKKVLSLC